MFRNSEAKSTKVIKIKTHDFFKTNNERTEDEIHFDEQKVTDLHKEIAVLTKQYEEIKMKQLELLQATKDQIEKEKVNWDIEKQNWIEQAKEEGFVKGYTEGEQQALVEYRNSINQINRIVDLANEDYHASIAKSDETILDLSIRVAEKIIQQKINEDPTNYISIVKAAIKELQDQSKISIFVHPENYSIVMDHKQELSQLLEENMKLSIYVKEELSKNACIIEHPFGQIDASVDTQLHEIRQVLQDVLQENAND